MATIHPKPCVYSLGDPFFDFEFDTAEGKLTCMEYRVNG